MLNRKQRILLSILTGVILSLGWPARGFPFLLLIGFCPLLLVQESLKRDEKKRKARAFFGHAYLAMLTWNVLTTWWVCNSTMVGGVFAITCNSLFMAIVLMLFHIVKRKFGNRTGYASLILFWMTFEYMHLNWQLSWPWLTLGFGFSNYTSCIQWYEFTGPFGGTLWILLCNIAMYRLVRNKMLNNTPITLKKVLTPLALVVIPVLLSLFIYIVRQPDARSKKIEVVIVQPNIDPYNEKFSGDYQTQVKKMLELADTRVDSNTSYLFFPETSLTEDVWENNFRDNFSIPYLLNYLKQHPKLCIVTGATTLRAYHKGDSIPESARIYDNQSGSWDVYNTALQVEPSGNLQVYHKCKLVPGVEFMPFHKLLAPLGNLAFNLGGTSGTLGTQKEPSVFYSPYSRTTMAPAICYESIYGDYIREYIKKGSQLIAIITNDGWQDTPGYRQHLCYGKLLGVETRRYVVQCANTGTSAVIDEKGNVLQKTGWWVPVVIKSEVSVLNGETFYVLHGDYIGLFACWLSLALIVYLQFKRISG